jgi:hypothetical protein
VVSIVFANQEEMGMARPEWLDSRLQAALRNVPQRKREPMLRFLDEYFAKNHPNMDHRGPPAGTAAARQASHATR